MISRILKVGLVALGLMWPRLAHAYPATVTPAMVILNSSAPQTGAVMNIDSGTVRGTLNVGNVNAGTMSVTNLTSGTGIINLNNSSLVNVANLNNTFIGWGRNRALNGDMRFNQRYETGKSTASTSTKYAMDHWSFSSDTGTYTMQMMTSNPPTGFTNYLQICLTNRSVSGSTSTELPSANDTFQQRLEGPYIKDWGWGAAGAKTISVSFVAISSVTGTYGMFIRNGSNSRSFISTFSITSANTWTPISMTIKGDVAGTWSNTVGARGAEIGFDLGSGSIAQDTNAGTWLAGSALRVTNNVMLSTQTVGNSFSITGFQVEIGSSPTTFESLPDDVELSRLQRYCRKSYQIGTATGTATTAGRISLSFAQINTTTMRSNVYQLVPTMMADPTVTLWYTDGTAGSWGFTNTTNTSTTRAVSTFDGQRDGFGVQQTTAVEFFGFGHYLAEAEVP